MAYSPHSNHNSLEAIASNGWSTIIVVEGKLTLGKRFWTVTAPHNSVIKIIPEVFQTIQELTLDKSLQSDHPDVIIPIQEGPRMMKSDAVILESN
ncbi:hypothetical protein TNIN_160461 [Trichonephila inaurata madagascariensis]|uniref:Uncharacterized protein n=1 Tax=Trichonephila inaurata madagascariensis TaxID=2747483 RepID=A0A8X7BY21_9ARAC|nr:hypothetical protein TNIN_160461 [Trichonephila inaurata madagascariensis]